MTENQTKNAFDEGFRSYRSRKGGSANPYGFGSVEHGCYERGWVQAVKRDSSGGENSSQAARPPKESVAAPRNEAAMSAYLRIKGRGVSSSEAPSATNWPPKIGCVPSFPKQRSIIVMQWSADSSELAGRDKAVAINPLSSLNL